MAEMDGLADAELWAAIDSAVAARTKQAVQSHRPVVESPQVGTLVTRSYQEHRGLKRHFEGPNELRNNVRCVRPALQEVSGNVDRKPQQIQRWTPESSAQLQAESTPWTQGGQPSSLVFRRLQDSAMAVLEKGDYMMMNGRPYIKKSGWRKIAFFFNLSFEIRDRKIELDRSANVLRAEFLVRASMQSGRFSDGWGSCDLREKRFSKPNHDIPSTAETRAKTRASQDLIGIGEYKGASDA